MIRVDSISFGGVAVADLVFMRVGCTPCNSPRGESNYHLKTNRNYPPLRGNMSFNLRHDSLELSAVSRKNEGRKQTKTLRRV